MLRVDPLALAKLVRDAHDLDPESVEIDEELWSLALANGAVSPAGPFEARFFHGTRTLAPERFTADGVLRLPEAAEGIWTDLETLTPDINGAAWRELRSAVETGGAVLDPGSAALYRTKVLEDPDLHGGVYAFLIRDVALQPPSGHHDYCDIPEIVEDIIRCAPPAWYLRARFMEASTPHLVHFSWPVDGDNWLKTALEYAWTSTHGDSFWNLTTAVNTGAAVPPDAILEVEPVRS